MLQEVQAFWDSLTPKIKQAIGAGTENCVRRERFDVSTAPNGERIGVRQPYGNEIFLPYGPEVAGASVGQTVIVEWRGSLSTGVAVSFGDGIPTAGTLYATVGTTWDGSEPYTQTISVLGMSASFTPAWFLVMPSDNQSAAIEAFKNIMAINAADNSITVYADAATNTEITLLLKL